MKVVITKITEKTHWQQVFTILQDNKVSKQSSRGLRLQILGKTLEYMKFEFENYIEIEQWIQNFIPEVVCCFRDKNKKARKEAGRIILDLCEKMQSINCM